MKAIFAVASAVIIVSAVAAHADQIQITKGPDRPPTKGATDFFTGDVTVKPYYGADQNPLSAGGLVEFPAGARTAWHTHPAGQTLIIMSGTGWVQEDGRERQVVREGDVVWFPAGVKHWHGASDTEAMSHIAITNMKDGKNVDWLEKVTDQQYLN
jgi:quercetin dioxygenase-like cupin family protein